MKLAFVVSLFVILTGCSDRESPVDKNQLLAADYRLFQDTPAWDLAKAVQDENEEGINNLIHSNKTLLGYQEPTFGESILELAVMNKNYHSVVALLRLGANPNLQDHDLGDSPLMRSIEIGLNGRFTDDRFLKVLLKNGGSANIPEHGPKKAGRMTPLMIACNENNLNYAKILIKAGADVNATNEYHDSALYQASVSEDPDFIIYLLKYGADYRRPLYIMPDGKPKYLTDALRYWRFDIGSNSYKKKMQIVDFLMKNGMDYWKIPIPEQFQDMPKDYLQKY